MVAIDGLEYSFGHRLPAGAEKSAQFVLLRLLLGSARIVKEGRALRQTTNYSLVPFVLQNASGRDSVAQFCSDYGVRLDSTSLIKKSLSDNRKFFRDILVEFSHYFLHTERASHLAAFVSLYRVLERMSYSLPLLYCSTQRDFTKTFEELKRFFSGVKGELGFFRNFINLGSLVGRETLDILCEINFVSSFGREQAYFDATKRCFDKFHIEDSSRAHFGVKFKDVGELLVAVRNRYFHLMSGGWKENISLTEIQDADEFFESLNPVFCNFLAVVTLSIIAHKYSS